MARWEEYEPRPPIRPSSSSLEEEPPLRTRLLFLAFALVVFLPLTQTNSGRKSISGPAPYLAVADAGPSRPTGLVDVPLSQTLPVSSTSPVGNSTGTTTTSGFTPPVVALAQSLLLWMGL
jgi:hypothetical protein